MTYKGIRMTAAAAAVLITASLAGQTMAQPQAPQNMGAQRDYHQGGDYGDRSYGQDNRGDYGRGDYGAQDREFGDRSFNDRDFNQRGRFYYGGEIRQRMERIEQWASFGARNGRLNRWEADRVYRMLDQIRQEARFARRDGYVSPREQMRLNARLDDAVRFLRRHMSRDGWNGGRHY